MPCKTQTCDALAREDARDIATSLSIANVGALVAIAKQQMQANSEGAAYYGQIIEAYASTSAPPDQGVLNMSGFIDFAVIMSIAIFIWRLMFHPAKE